MSNKLSKYFKGIVAKRLSEVEVNPARSNQHEFNATSDLKEVFGMEKEKFNSTFIFLNDENEPIKQSGTLTWYDARENHPSRSEHRFYYNNNEVINSATPGDLMVIGRTSKKEVAVIIAPKGSTVEEQLIWLFDLKKVDTKFVTKDFSEKKKELGFAGKYIISSLGFEVVEPEPDYLEIILGKFGGIFPSTAIFSDFARTITKKDVDPVEAPDEALLKFMEKEQILFKTLESYLVKEKLKHGFGKDNNNVDEFIKFSLSVQNRRKSRAGAAFEHHVAYILDCNKIKYSRQPETERHNTPDFIFPGIKEYRNNQFNFKLLTMLGLKTSAKERWAQILQEADRIPTKHLLTLEPAVSKNQTDEMVARKVRLVIPGEIIETYSIEQKRDIISFSDFLEEVREKAEK